MKPILGFSLNHSHTSMSQINSHTSIRSSIFTIDPNPRLMKHALLTILSVALLIPRSQAQTFASIAPAANDMMQPHVADFTTLSNASKKPKKTVMIAGFTGMGAGVTLSLVGVIVEFTDGANANNSSLSYSRVQYYERAENAGKVMSIVGAVLFVSSSVTAIVGGAIYHYKRARKYSITSPKRNQLGLAYNF